MEETLKNSELQIEGTVDRIVFEAPDGTFSVLSLKSKDRGRVTVTLASEPPKVGEEAKFRGVYIEHPKFGEQFRATNIELIRPTNTARIERFLASGAIEGIRAGFAKRIVEKFGIDTLDIIENSPQRLKEIPGIGKKTIEKITESYMKQSELRDIMLWLETHGVSGTFAARIFKKYSSFSIDMLENHPYQLAEDIKGIGFQTADTIARSIGLSPEDEERIRAGVIFSLGEISMSGHTCAPMEYLIKESARNLRIEDTYLIENIINNMTEENAVDFEDIGGVRYIYSHYLYEAETLVARRVKEIKESARYFGVKNTEEFIADWEEQRNIRLAEKQKDAIKYALSSGIFVLTGGPGTGKTTVVRGIIELLEKIGCKILLGAPTGRAAKRLTEATGRRAKTVHRMLEAQGIPGAGFEFLRDEANPLEADVIILDEVSMMDIVLMRHFLMAVPDGAHVILVGDVDQLPAVGPGLVLKDIIASKVGNSVMLNEIFRQTEESSIVVSAHAINHGRFPKITDDGEFRFVELDTSEKVAKFIEYLVTEALPHLNFSPLTDVQVLSPMHKDLCGTHRLNIRLQSALNPPSPLKKEISFGGQTFRVNDKVMQTKNNYEKKVFNGDIGFISAIEDGKVQVNFDGEILAAYEKDEISELTLAYAMSVHKSQGSEYPVIILPLVSAHYIMLQRNLLYTAVTRAKDLVILIGKKSALNTAIMNDRTRKRYTLLKERLSDKLEC